MPVRIKNVHKTSNGINRHPQEIAFWLRKQRCRADLSTFATLANLYGISADEVLDIGGKASSDSLPQCEFQVLSTTIYLWLISLTASKDLSISLLKLYNDGAIGISDSFLDFASVIKTDNQFLIRSVRFMQVESLYVHSCHTTVD